MRNILPHITVSLFYQTKTYLHLVWMCFISMSIALMHYSTGPTLYLYNARLHISLKGSFFITVIKKYTYFKAKRCTFGKVNKSWRLPLALITALKIPAYHSSREGYGKYDTFSVRIIKFSSRWWHRLLGKVVCKILRSSQPECDSRWIFICSPEKVSPGKVDAPVKLISWLYVLFITRYLVFFLSP